MTRAAARGLGLLTAALAVALAAAALAVALAAAALAAPPRAALPAAPPDSPRCYWIDQPLTRLQPLLLNRGLLDCRLSRCQLTLRQTPIAGWVCFFARPWG